MKSFFIDFLKGIVTVVISAAVGLILLLLVFLLPIGRIQGNVYESVSVLASEANVQNIYFGFNSSVDNYTDGIMIEAASYVPQEEVSLLDRVLQIYIVDGRDENGWSISINHLIADYFTNAPDVTYIEMTYPRYWHGYLVYLKPLLTVFDWTTIRMLNFAFQVLLAALLIWMLVKKNKKGLILPFVMSYLMLIPTVIGRCMQLSDCYYIYVLALIFMVWKFDWLMERRRMDFLFLWIGIILAYVDFLTYPLVTFIIPLMAYFALKGMSGTIRDILDMIEKGLFWGVGYVGMWASKWILASIFTDENVVMNAIEQIIYRTSSTDSTGSYEVGLGTVLGVNIGGIINPFTMLAVIMTVGLLVYSLIKKQFDLRQAGLFFLLGITPFMWYVICREHSYQHYYFTSKELIITGFAMLCMFMPGLCAKNET